MNNLPPMTLFDYMVSSRENNILKAFLPYIDKDFQPLLATYIKYTELLATIELFNKRGRNVFPSNSNSQGFTDIISSILPYVSNKEREAFETINNIKNTMEMFEMYKDMMSPDMADAFAGFTNSDTSSSKEDFNNDESSNSTSNTMDNNMSDMFSSIFSPEQMAMFEQFSSMMNIQ